MNIRCISVGKHSDKPVQELQSEYEKRLSRWTKLEWQLIPHGTSAGHESVQILKRIKPDDFVVLLDERGVISSTEEMTVLLDGWIGSSKHIVFVIGGAYGVDDSIHTRANYVWSFSRLVFPHQLMRVLLSEQLYRMFTVRDGGKYHHG